MFPLQQPVRILAGLAVLLELMTRTTLEPKNAQRSRRRKVSSLRYLGLPRSPSCKFRLYRASCTRYNAPSVR
ncbi:hypothetical protein B0H16DRAFT_1527472, partial [Mycena metata]